jgi:hypothetical protein
LPNARLFVKPPRSRRGSRDENLNEWVISNEGTSVGIALAARCHALTVGIQECFVAGRVGENPEIRSVSPLGSLHVASGNASAPMHIAARRFGAWRLTAHRDYNAAGAGGGRP